MAEQSDDDDPMGRVYGIKVRQLIDAVKENDVNLVETLLKDGVTPNVRDYDGLPLLMFACELGLIEVIKHLINYGADVNALRTARHTTAIMFSVMRQDPEAVRLLLDAGADVNLRNIHGFTVLMLAIGYIFEDMVHMLLQHGTCSLEAKDNAGRTALHLAVPTSNMSILDSLLKSGAAPNTLGPKGDIALMHATEVEVAKLLLAVGSDPNHKDMYGRPCLDYSIMNQVPNVASVLIKAGADVNAEYQSGMTPLFRALLHWVPDVVEMLVDNGALVTYVNEKNRGAIYHAAAVPDAFICQYLLDKGADPDTLATDGSTPIYIAVSRHNSPVAKLLLRNNVRLDRLYPHSNTVTNSLTPRTRLTLLDIAIHEELSDLVPILYDVGCPVGNCSFPESNRYSPEILSVLKQLNEPRTLLNTVRNSIRKYLGSRLIHGVSTLGLPTSLIEVVAMTESLKS